MLELFCRLLTNQNLRFHTGVMYRAGTFLQNFDQSEYTVSHGRDVKRWNFFSHIFDQSEWRIHKGGQSKFRIAHIPSKGAPPPEGRRSSWCYDIMKIVDEILFLAPEAQTTTDVQKKFEKNSRKVPHSHRFI